MAMTSQFQNMAKYMDVHQFIEHSILNDTNTVGGQAARSNGVLRLNRFVGVLSLINMKVGKGPLFNNNEISDGGWGTDFLSWNIFKIDCPALRIGIEAKEVDMRPRYYFKNWEYDDLSVSFLESSDLKMRHFFFEWMECALTARSYARSYYDDVMSPWFIIYPLNFRGQAERYEIFRELVPFDISSINYDVSDNGEQVMLTTVKFKYTSHEVLSLPRSQKS